MRTGRPGQSTRLVGHSLRHEGDAFSWQGDWWVGSAGPGHGKCECGEMSELLPNRAARKRWHREHKEEKRKS